MFETLTDEESIKLLKVPEHLKTIENELTDESEAETKEKRPDNPRKGVIYFLLSGFCFSAHFICGKVLFERDPTLTPLGMVYYRSIVSTIIMAAYVNKD